MPRSKRTGDLIPTDPDLDKTLRQLKKQGKGKQKKTHSQKSSTTQSDTRKEMTDNRSLNSYGVPSQDGIPTGLKMPEITAENFEIKPTLLSMVQQNQFSGHPTDEPINHLQRFQQLCSTVHHKGVTQDQLKVMLFGFSLRDRAQKWLNTVEETEWSKISQAFLKEYFPPEKTEKIRHQISTFSQESGESLREAWDRFLDLQRSCPHHNFEKWNLVRIFYNGLEPETKCIVDSAAGGVFLDKTIEEGYDFLANLAANHFSSPRTRAKKGKMEVEAYSILTSQMAQ